MAGSAEAFGHHPDRGRHGFGVPGYVRRIVAGSRRRGYLSAIGRGRAGTRGDCIMWPRHGRMSGESTRFESAAVSGQSLPACRIPAVLLDRAGRVIHLNAAAAQLAPAAAQERTCPVRVALARDHHRACAKAIATHGKPRRATYLDHVPVDRWMELIITPVPVPTLFGGNRQMHADDVSRPDAPLRRVEENGARRFRGQCPVHELAATPAGLRCRAFIDTLQGPAKEDAKGARGAFPPSASCTPRRRGWRG